MKPQKITDKPQNVLTRYLDTETTRADARLVHLVLITSDFGRPRCPVKMLPDDWNASVFREWLASVTASIASRTFNTQSNLDKV